MGLYLLMNKLHKLQLQEESEVRDHELKERLRSMVVERDEALTKLEDKQREVDDLTFRLEEEAITKDDLEVRYL